MGFDKLLSGHLSKFINNMKSLDYQEKIVALIQLMIVIAAVEHMLSKDARHYKKSMKKLRKKLAKQKKKMTVR